MQKFDQKSPDWSVAAIGLIEQRWAQICDSGINFSPSGTSVKEFARLQADCEGLFWPIAEYQSLLGLKLCMAELKQLDLYECHPVRAFILMRELTSALSGSITDLSEFERELRTEFFEFVDNCDELLSRFDKFVEDLRQGNYIKPELLEAFNFPFVSSEALEYTFDKFHGLDATLFNFDRARNKDRVFEGSEILHPYIASSLSDIVQALTQFSYSTGQRFLDVGCGAGATLIAVALMSDLKVIGIDISAEWFGLGRAAAASLGIEGIKFVKQDALKDKLPEAEIIYFYSPFNEVALISEFFKRIKRQFKDRDLTVWAPDYSKFDQAVGAEKWLNKNQRVSGISSFKSNLNV